jgi:RNA polymerase sigma-70 factor, ECF subfamily
VRSDARRDGELLEAAAHGDEDAFAALVLRHVRAATLYAAQLSGDRDDAEDLVQSAFILAYDRAPTLDPARPFSAWLFAVIRRMANRQRARRAHRGWLRSRWELDTERHAPDGAARTDAESDLAIVRRAMRALPPMQRVCLELVAIHEIAIDEVAAMYEISPSTVRQHLFRARRVLRAQLGNLSVLNAPLDMSALRARADSDPDSR